MTVDAGTCITCGDTAVAGKVVEIAGPTATVELDGRRESVGIELVAPIAVGDVLLCHAGVALAKVEGEP